MPPPTSASRHYRRIQRLAAVTISAARRSWQKMDPARNWEQQYAEPNGIGTELLVLAAAAQVAAVRESDTYVANVLNELAFGPETTPGVLDTAGFLGVMGDGRPVESLLEQTVVKAGQSFNDAASGAGGSMTNQIPGVFDRSTAAETALEDAQKFVDRIFHEIVAETARAAESAASAQRPWVDGWVRMLNPPACSRCVVLAGQFYLWSDGFERHPECDCTHIPAPEAAAGDLVIDPDAYFHSLPAAEQDRAFGKAGAQAIRDGADIAQVVNARRGMQKAQVFGKDVVTTTSGTVRGRQRGKVRLMPESIYDEAKDHEDAIRLLKLHGFIF